MFWCRSGKKILVKNSWGSAEAAGVRPGMEIVRVDGVAVDKWLDGRIAELADKIGFSTDAQAFFYACHWGLAEKKGTRRLLELRNVKGQRGKVTIDHVNANTVAQGPAFFPDGLENMRGDVRYGKTDAGFGYVHVRRCPGDLPDQIDRALVAIGEVPGLILDFRGNSGGGFDHDAFFGRFVPSGEQIAFAKRYSSAGAAPYGGPIVVIIDATVRSAGETAAGIFKEDGRGFDIGESSTAGMSSQKETIELPSGYFSLYVSVRSNVQRFNRGRGLEGIGVEPHQLVELEAADLAKGLDTAIQRAQELLAKFPQDRVLYDPKDFGWTAPPRRRSRR
jgi:C-terminal processing protease CtpA/Prc